MKPSERERRRRAEHYASQNNGEVVTKRVDIVTKIVKGKKRGRGRPSLSGSPMTDAERARRYRARKKAGGR